jgi:hypothetical protein
MKMKKIIFGIVFSVFALALVVVPTLAAGKAAPKATGSYDYNYGIDRHADFNAITTSTSCSYQWNVTGNWGLDYIYNGVHNPSLYDVQLTQTNGVLTGTGKYPLGAVSPSYQWGVTGTVVGNTVNITAVYTVGAVGTTMTMAGTIASDGTMTGTWSDNYGGTRTGEWSSSTGVANKMFTGCTGKGSFNYSDANGTYYTVDVKYVSVDGNKAWFAGPVVSGNMGGYGQYLFVKVVDNGEPGIADTSTGDFPLTEAQAMFKVASHASPIIPDITINGGNIQVHN